MGILVELKNIRKRFGPFTALDSVSLSFTPGRVHGLLGENGAGKSTLMNILYGLLRPDSGQILIDGRVTKIQAPLDALRAGIGMVHQHFMLGRAMSVLDNVLLGDRRAGRWLNRTRAGKTLRDLSIDLGLPIDPSARISDLSVGQQQRVEILKVLYRQAHILILDEPTAVLTPAETDQLFAAVNRLTAAGKSIVFISHKLREIKQICDDLTVLRRGQVVFQGEATGVTPSEISLHMIGRDVQPIRLERKELPDQKGLPSLLPAPIETDRKGLPSLLFAPGNANSLAALQLEAVSLHPLQEVSLHIQPGEILGIAGVDGNGQQELAEAILGLQVIGSGTVRLNHQDIALLTTAERAAIGIAHIPNDRKREGLVGGMSLTENLALKHRFSRFGLMQWPTARLAAQKLLTAFDIRTPSPDTPVSFLSGGNQQKVILARELAIVEPKLVVAMNPVRGLDVAATQFVYEQLLACRARGGAVLLISSELDELLALCDRIGVLYAGRLTMSRFPAEGAAEIGQMMTGASTVQSEVA